MLKSDDAMLGGTENKATGNTSFIGGGTRNEASGMFSAVLGGENCSVSS